MLPYSFSTINCIFKVIVTETWFLPIENAKHCSSKCMDKCHVPIIFYLDTELLSSSESSVIDEIKPETDETVDKLAGTMLTERQ